MQLFPLSLEIYLKLVLGYDFAPFQEETECIYIKQMNSIFKD
jgi:hypothetical protein